MKKFLKNLIEHIYLSFDDNLVYYDSTTHCKSRFYYDSIVRDKYKRKECIIVFIDINNLKKINDEYGHYYGTIRIKNISKSLRLLKNVECICRIGGDEFVLICNKNFNKEDLMNIKGISYGIVHKLKYDSLSYSIQKADEEMYKMKKAMRQS